MSTTPQQRQAATDLLLQLWARRGEEPPVAGADWLQGPWGEILAAAEMETRAAPQHLPIALLLSEARALAQGAQTVTHAA